MSYIPVNPRIGMQAIAVTDTTQNLPLGTKVWAYDPTYGEGEFIYLSGIASTVVGSWVSYNPDDNSTALLAANAAGDVAIAMSANVASQYGWYQIGGKAIGKAAASFVDNAEVYATATAGTVDDAVVSGDKVFGVKGASAVDTPSTGLAEFEISRPYIRNGLLVDSTELTATTAELNILDGVTATAAELNILSGVTSSAAELNIMDGVLATAAEINGAADVSGRLVSIGDVTTYALLVANSGKPHIIPDLTSTCTISTPVEASGLEYDLIYAGVAADAADWLIDTGANANYFLGGLLHADTDAGAAGIEAVTISGDGNSNSKLTIVKPAPGTRVKIVCDGTHWVVVGTAVSITVPAFADQ